MAQPLTFQRIYPHALGIEYPADAKRVATVLRSMQEHRDSTVPFKVRVRLDDGSAVVFRPKGQR